MSLKHYIFPVFAYLFACLKCFIYLFFCVCVYVCVSVVLFLYFLFAFFSMWALQEFSSLPFGNGGWAVPEIKLTNK